MRTLKLLAAIGLLSIAACSSKPVFTAKQRDAVVAKFDRYCMGDYAGSIRSCDSSDAYMVYQRSNGQIFHGKLIRLDRETGELTVSWYRGYQNIKATEDLYLGTSQVLPGKVIEVVDATTEFPRWLEVQNAWLTNPPMTMLR